MGEARGSELRAPWGPKCTAPARAPQRARRPLPGRPRPPPRAPGRGPPAIARAKGCTYQTGSGPLYRRSPAARRRGQSTRSAQAHPRSRHRPAALTSEGRGGNAGAPGGCRPGCRGPLQEKVMYPLVSGAPGQGRPASPRRAGTCRCHRGTTRSARGRRYLPGGEVWLRRSGERRGGAAVAAAAVAAAGGRGAASQSPRRDALTPHPAASPTPSCDSVSRWMGRGACPSGGRAECVPMATGAREGRGRAPRQPGSGRSVPRPPAGGLLEPGGGGGAGGVRFR